MKRLLFLPLCLLVLLLGLLLSGCDCCPPGQDDPLATEILGVRVEPNPVPVGSTTTFTVVIRDSTETGFSYYWSVPGGAGTVVPRYTWTPTVEPGEYTLRVRVSRDGAYEPVQRTFTVTVIAQ